MGTRRIRCLNNKTQERDHSDTGKTTMQTNLIRIAAIGSMTIAFLITTPRVRQCQAAQPPAEKEAKSKKRSNTDFLKKALEATKKGLGVKKFRWVNPVKSLPVEQLQHATFLSSSLKTQVGYFIYLPDAYEQSTKRKFPVVYYLHGGRPGSEAKSVRLITQIHEQIRQGTVPPMIYVFVNGGPVSHYNVPGLKNGHGAVVFIKELIPHIDKTYRTIAHRNGRAIEGFSQGGRGTARLMFRYPELFCSAAPGGGGHATEKKISENEGRENAHLQFAPGDNTWDLARAFAKSERLPLRILIYVGDKGFNYENNLQYMEHLRSLRIPFESLIVPDAPHSGKIIYEKRAAEIMKFHAQSFRDAAAAR